MTKYNLPYGHKEITFELPDGLPADLILPSRIPGMEDPEGVVKAGLSNPIGFDLEMFIRSVSPHPTVAIAINDKTRPVPHHLLLPPLLTWLENEGIPSTNIKFMVASGTHTPMQPEEYPLILPEQLIGRYPIIVHDCDDASTLTDLGTSSIGTPILINRDFLESDLRIVVGDIEPHHFMGYSGGVKTAAIGLAGRETIRANHAFITHSNARTSCYDDNPMRQDVEDIGKRIGVHLAVNAIMNHEKQIVRVLVGNPQSVIRAGIPLVRQICQVSVNRLYDVVIASAGGHPKDINFYQAQKGLTHAAMMTRPGGIILLAAECPDGAGNWLYENWMRGKASHRQVLDDFATMPFEIGVHKAFLVSRIAVAKRVIVTSNLPLETSRQLLLESTPTLQQGVDAILSIIPRGSRIAILPQAVLTVPDLDMLQG